jgi:hypothetical protein
MLHLISSYGEWICNFSEERVVCEVKKKLGTKEGKAFLQEGTVVLFV